MREVNTRQMLEFTNKAKRSVPESPEGKAARVEAENAVRKLLHGHLVSTGVNPHLAARVFNYQSNVRVAIGKLETAGIAIGAEGTIRADLGGAAKLLTDELRIAVRGVKGSVVTDGASFKHSKAVAIMFASSALSEPVLLDLVHPNELEVYDHKKNAEDIRAALVRFDIDLHDQVRISVYRMIYANS